jgi:hypothetical protein
MQIPTGFQRSIGLPAASSIVVGSIIGSGIFYAPSEMAALLGSPCLDITGMVNRRCFYSFCSNGECRNWGNDASNRGAIHVYANHLW